MTASEHAEADATGASAPPPRVFLDAGGRAPVHPVAREAYLAALDEGWADPRRLHTEGRRARLLLDGARQSVATSLGARTEEVHFSPGHTASLHAAVQAVAAGRRRAGSRVAVSAVERAAVLQAAGSGDRQAVTVGVDRHGLVDAEAMAAAIGGDGVALAALQHANGEVGTLQPVPQVHQAARAAGVPLLVDAGASLGHHPVDGSWDLLAADPGDWGGPSGIGVLAVRAQVRWRAVWPPDEDEGGWFPGGPSVPTALAAAASLRAVLADQQEQGRRRSALVDRIRAAAAAIADVEVVGDPVRRLPHVVTFSCLYVDGEAVVGELDAAGFSVGSGSACTASTLEPSHVLAAMGVLTHGNVRVVLPREVTEQQVTSFCDALPTTVRRVRELLGTQGL